jgi:hypothetical protein
MSPEKLAKECADKLREIFDGVEVEGSTIYYKGQLLISSGWIWGGENIPPEPAFFVETINGGKIIISLDGAFEDADVRLLTHTIASIVAWETIGRAGDATIFSDDTRVRVCLGDFKHSLMTLEFPYICPCMDIRSYRIKVCLYRQGGLKVEPIGEFEPADFDTLRKIVGLYLL